jgi:hypothetical protein
VSVLGRTRHQIEALARFVEAKCLVGGVTTSQGITLSSNNRLRRYFRGVVRNVEQTGDKALPQAQTRVPDVAAKDAERFLRQLDRGRVWLLHLSEGVDERARALSLAPDQRAAVGHSRLARGHPLRGPQG